jgi:hypothetical protein
MTTSVSGSAVSVHLGGGGQDSLPWVPKILIHTSQHEWRTFNDYYSNLTNHFVRECEALAADYGD